MDSEYEGLGAEQLIELFAQPGKDRSHPLAFAGRARELAFLGNALDTAKAGGKGLSCVVHGIPGSGKTALVEQFCRQAARGGAVAVRFDGSDVDSRSGVAKRIEDMIHQDLAIRRAAGRRGGRILPARLADAERRTRAVLSQTEETTRSVGRRKRKTWNLFGLLRIEDAQPSDGRDAMFSNLLERLPGPRDVPVIVFVDEAQNLPDAAKSIVGTLHTQRFGRPILPIYVGTAPVEKRLPELGVSRNARGFFVDPLGPIGFDAALSSIRSACGRFAADSRAIEAVAPPLAQATQGFPAHVDSAVCAVAGVMAANGMRLPEGAVDDCLAAAAAQRRIYYEARMQAANDPPITLLAVLARAAKDLGPDDWAQADSVLGEYGTARDRLPEGDCPDLHPLLASCESAGIARTKRSTLERKLLFQFVAPSFGDFVLDVEREARR